MESVDKRKRDLLLRSCAFLVGIIRFSRKNTEGVYFCKKYKVGFSCKNIVMPLQGNLYLYLVAVLPIFCSYAAITAGLIAA